MTTPDWDANAYHHVSEPQFLWGLHVLEGLTLEGGETVVDAGCGSGRLTAELLNRLPRGHVIALDSSQNMLDRARRELSPKFGKQVTFVKAALPELNLNRPVDVIFSTATFHWVPDHDALMKSLAKALRPQGRLWAQCGGQGNLQRAYAHAEKLMNVPRYAPAFVGWKDPTNFAGVAATEARLEAAGFDNLDVTLVPAPTPFASDAALAEFLTAVVLRHHLAALPQSQRPEFLSAVVEGLAQDTPPRTLDYVRLNLHAVRG